MVAPTDESADDQDGGGEAEGGVAVAAAAVGVAAELPVVRPPRVGGFDDPAQPEPDRLLAHAGDLGAAELDVEVGHPERFESAAHRAGVVAAVEVQHADLAEQAGLVDGVEGGFEETDVYFQEVGPGEKEPEADPHRTMRPVIRGVSGDANPLEAYAPLPAVGTGPSTCSANQGTRHPNGSPTEDIKVFADNFETSGFFGPLSWYRNIDDNYEASKDLDPARVSMPSFFIAGDRDGAAIAFDLGGETMKTLLPDLRGVTILPGVGH